MYMSTYVICKVRNTGERDIYQQNGMLRAPFFFFNLCPRISGCSTSRMKSGALFFSSHFFLFFSIFCCRCGISACDTGRMKVPDAAAYCKGAIKALLRLYSGSI